MLGIAEHGAVAGSFGFTGTLDAYRPLAELHTGQSTGCAWLGSVTVAYDWALPPMDTQMAHHRRLRWRRVLQIRPLDQQECLKRPRLEVPLPSFSAYRK